MKVKYTLALTLASTSLLSFLSEASAAPAPIQRTDAAPDDIGGSASDELGIEPDAPASGDDDLRQEVVALRAQLRDMDACRRGADGLDEDEKAQLSILAGELTHHQAQLTSLNQAVASGLDKSAVQHSLTFHTQEVQRITAQISEIEARAMPPSLALRRVTAKIDNLAASFAEGSSQDAYGVNGMRRPDDVGEPSGTATERAPVGVSVGVEIASMYNFRGLNVFQSGSQSDQHALLAPALSYSYRDGLFTVGYWGAYQWTGPNQVDNVDAGIGHEQDLYVSHEGTIVPDVGYGVGLTYYAYPFADESVAGTKWPSYLEPFAGVSWEGPVDLGLNVAYLVGIQDAVSAGRYAYLNPTLGKRMQITESADTGVAAGFGYKIFHSGGATQSNAFDVGVHWDASISASDNFSVSPGVHYAWTNLEDSTAVEHAVWGSVGADVGF